MMFSMSFSITFAVAINQLFKVKKKRSNIANSSSVKRLESGIQMMLIQERNLKETYQLSKGEAELQVYFLRT